MKTEQWEINYKKNKEINKYPFDVIISFWFRNKHLIKKDKNEKFKICELGCGCGNNLAFFAENNCEVYGIDISPSAIDKAKTLFKNKNLKGTLVVGNLLEHNFEDNTFDFVLDRGCFTHNPYHIEECINISYKLLKNSGLFLSMLCGKDHSWLEYELEYKDENIYEIKNKNSPWYNLPLITVNYNDIIYLFKNYKILDVINSKDISEVNKSLISWYYIHCHKI